jgi:hypothetical protein
MHKDLFIATFEHLAKWSLATYRAEYLEQLPYRLLSSAISINPSLTNCQGIDDVMSVVTSDGARCNNPELYPYLNCLMIPGYAALQGPVDAIRTHLGLEAIEPAALRERRFWRMRFPSPEVFENVNGAVCKITGVISQASPGKLFPLVYSPHPNLFDDIDSRHYRGAGFNGTRDLCMFSAEGAVRLMNLYCPVLASNFCREIKTIAFMPGQVGDARSFSMRNFYVGGIFVSLSDPIKLAEQFIHEYYHQCIWPWWMIDAPADLPTMDVTVESPVTGRIRPVPTMMHALLIYCSLIDYYRFVLSDGICMSSQELDVSKAKARLEQIACRIGALDDTLKKVLHDRPSSLAFVEFISRAIKSNESRVNLI